MTRRFQREHPEKSQRGSPRSKGEGEVINKARRKEEEDMSPKEPLEAESVILKGNDESQMEKSSSLIGEKNFGQSILKSFQSVIPLSRDEGKKRLPGFRIKGKENLSRVIRSNILFKTVGPQSQFVSHREEESRS